MTLLWMAGYILAGTISARLFRHYHHARKKLDQFEIDGLEPIVWLYGMFWPLTVFITVAWLAMYLALTLVVTYVFQLPATTRPARLVDSQLKRFAKRLAEWMA